MERKDKKAKIIINVGIQSDGYVFRLQPKSRHWLQENYPHTNIVSSIFIGFDTKQEFEEIHGSIWEQVSKLLTGLSLQELNTLGGFAIYSPSEKKEIMQSSHIRIEA